MKEIPLTQGKVAFVDDEWYDYLMQWKWCYHKRLKTGYAVRTECQKYHQRTILMHAVIAGTPPGMDTDHIDGNRLNNLSKNLRICTHAKNVANQSIQKRNTSGYKGVWWDKLNKKWQVQICNNKKRIYLGRFSDPEDAARAYDAAAIKYFGEFACLNFPMESVG